MGVPHSWSAKAAAPAPAEALEAAERQKADHALNSIRHNTAS